MNADLPFRLLVGLVFAGVIWMVSRYRQGAQGGESISLEREGWALAVPLRLVGLVLWLYLPLYVLFPQLMSWSTLELPAAARWAGLAVGALAVPPFIFWAQRSLGSNVTSTVVTKQNHQLVTDGPYRTSVTRCIRPACFSSSPWRWPLAAGSCCWPS